MSRMSRAEVFDPNEVAIGHFYSRTVRRFFVMGEDPVSGKNSIIAKLGSKAICSNSPHNSGLICWPFRFCQIISISFCARAPMSC